MFHVVGAVALPWPNGQAIICQRHPLVADPLLLTLAAHRQEINRADTVSNEQHVIDIGTNMVNMGRCNICLLVKHYSFPAT